MYKRYVIVHEPRGFGYADLLSFCGRAGSWCSLVDLHPKSRKSEVFLKRAEPFAIGVDHVKVWPGGAVRKGVVRLWKSSLTSELLALVAESAPGIFAWRGPKLPEDLAFYREDGSVLLGTVAHEHLGWMYLSEHEVRDKLLGSVELIHELECGDGSTVPRST